MRERNQRRKINRRGVENCQQPDICKQTFRSLLMVFLSLIHFFFPFFAVVAVTQNFWNATVKSLPLFLFCNFFSILFIIYSDNFFRFILRILLVLLSSYSYFILENFSCRARQIQRTIQVIWKNSRFIRESTENWNKKMLKCMETNNLCVCLTASRSRQCQIVVAGIASVLWFFQPFFFVVFIFIFFLTIFFQFAFVAIFNWFAFCFFLFIYFLFFPFFHCQRVIEIWRNKKKKIEMNWKTDRNLCSFRIIISHSLNLLCIWF